MNKEMQQVIQRLNMVLDGEPWFGRSVYALLEEADPARANWKPGGQGHSMTELIYHMVTWSEFTLKRIEKDDTADMRYFDNMDWRPVDPATHTWKKGVALFKSTQKKIISLLKKKNDAFLDEKVDFRAYNFRFLLNGMIEHHIYHTGQIAYLHKWLPGLPAK